MLSGNDENQGSDEATPLLGDDLASSIEIEKAIKSLFKNESKKKRLVAIAALILQNKSNLKRQYHPEDLFQEALERIAIGNRKWPKNRVDFDGLVIGVMKSWASSLEKTKAIEDNKVIMEYELASVEEGGESLNLEEVAVDSSPPFAQMEQYEINYQECSILLLLMDQLVPQQLPAKILGAIINKQFETHHEIRSSLNVGNAIYNNAWKVLMRAARKLKPKD